MEGGMRKRWQRLKVNIFPWCYDSNDVIELELERTIIQVDCLWNVFHQKKIHFLWISFWRSLFGSWTVCVSATLCLKKPIPLNICEFYGRGSATILFWVLVIIDISTSWHGTSLEFKRTTGKTPATLWASDRPTGLITRWNWIRPFRTPFGTEWTN